MVFGQLPFTQDGELLRGEKLLHAKKLAIRFPEDQVLSHCSDHVTAVTVDVLG